MEVNINKANNCRYNPATFMVLGGRLNHLPPPHTGTHSLLYFLCSKHYHGPMSCDKASTCGEIYARLYCTLWYMYLSS